MIRTLRLTGISSLSVGNSVVSECITLGSVYTQCIRWKRKPIWLPTAKSKMFRIPKRPVIPPEDNDELKRLFNEYRTYMKSLRHYFEQITAESQVKIDESTGKAKQDEDFKICDSINTEWNKQIAAMRDARLLKEREARKEQIKQNLELNEQKYLELQQKVEENVKKVKEEVHTFITPSNIDKAIEEALNTTVNHNFAIDLEGNIYEKSYHPMATLTKSGNKLKEIEQHN